VTPDAGAFVAEARDWLAAHVPPGPLPSVDTAEGFEWHRGWERALAAARLSVVSWPAQYGGRDASLLDWLVFEEAYYAAGGPVRVGQNGLFLLAPTLFAHGTKEQRDRLLPPMARADEIWAQAWSEPEAGSDLAAIRSRAVRTDGGWLLSGTKTWSSRAAFADRAFGLFRTGTSANAGGDAGAGGDARAGTGAGGDRHQGLTYLLFGLRDPGVTVRPIRQLGGETGFAEIFLDDVFVPDANVIGAPGDGWRIAMSTASHERGLSLRSPGRFLAAADRLVELWRRDGDPADSATAHRVANAWIGARAYQLHTNATAVRLAEGATLGAEASMGKVFWSELDIALHETALDVLGPRAEIRGERWLEGYLFALAGPIYAGTNEIQRTVIAERVLRLPRVSAGSGQGDRSRALPTRQGTGAAALHDLLRAADVPAAARSWAVGDLAPGRALWERLAGLGVTALAVPEKWGGLNASATDIVTACEELGHHAVPGPVAESLAAVPALLSTLTEMDWRAGPGPGDSPAPGDPADRHDDSADRCGEWLAGLATGDLIATLAMPPRLPFAADAEAAGLVLLAESDAISVGRASARHRSVDPSRSLSVVTGDHVLARSAVRAMAGALDLGALACSAQLLGAGRALLEASVRHASVRTQFGRPVGTFQAVKHKLADVAIALEFARPLLDAAAAAIDGDAPTVPRDVSAAKVACADAAMQAARAALQIHGAIGYTAEHDLSLWLTKVRALVPAWGSQAWHRQRVLAGPDVTSRGT
jgi:alkylation response protein AidB-like acyl-CoA dehydrogenase